MSRNQRQLRRKRKKRWRMFFVFFIFGYLFFRSVPSLFAFGSKVALPEKVVVEDKIETEAIIIKKENLYKTDGEGRLEILVEEGERIPVGTKIGQITLLKDTSTLNQELEEVDKKIEALTKTEMDSEALKIDEEKIEQNIDSIIKNIQESISEGNYEKAEILKDKLSIYDSKQKDLGGSNTLISQSLENLNKKREELASNISSNTINYFSKESGIVSFKIDGYEDMYPYDYRNDYEYSDFKKLNQEDKSLVGDGNVKAGEPIFKVIDNFEWYMIIKIENMKDINDYEEGNYILLTSSQIEDELEGRIMNIKKDGNKGLIICKFNTDFHNVYDKRCIDINLVKHKQDGYKIPRKSVVEEDGIIGVYVKEISGIIKFRPVEILLEENDIAYISCGDNNSNIKLEGSDKLVRTVRQFDEILINTINIKDGMIID